jgi:hypothetical protein
MPRFGSGSRKCRSQPGALMKMGYIGIGECLALETEDCYVVDTI